MFLNLLAWLMTIKILLWLYVIAGFLVIILTLGSDKPEKKYIRLGYKTIITGAFFLWMFPFLSTFIKGPTPGVSAEDNLSYLASKSPFYGVLSRLPDWALIFLLVLSLIVLGVILWYRHKHPKSDNNIYYLAKYVILCRLSISSI